MITNGRLVEVNGTRLWVTSEGSGTPIILIHGGPGASCDYLAPVSAMLADRACVHRYDQRACGQSAKGGPFDVSTAVADLEALRCSLHHDRWTLLGHSYGALLALAYAIQHPHHVQSLIYVAGTGIDNTWKAEYRKNRDRAPAELLPDFGRPGSDEVNRLGNAAIEKFLADTPLAQKLPHVTAPCIVIHGDADLRPQWPVERVAELLPHSRLVVIPGAPHYIWLTHAAEFSQRIRGFLDEVVGKPEEAPT